MDRRLNGKNAIITGANRGIGNAIVHEMAEEGANIWAFSRSKNESFEAEMQGLSKECNVWIEPVYLELTDEEAMKQVMREIYSEKKSIDILVNAAGILHQALFQMSRIEDMRHLFEVDFFAPVLLTQQVLHGMSRNKSGSIINITSVSGMDAHPLNCTYGSAKAALAMLTKDLAAEVASQGIRVNAVAPGNTDTDMIKNSYIDKPSVLDQMYELTSMHRLAKPEEIAKTVSFLASDEASFINGQVIRVDGGAV